MRAIFLSYRRTDSDGQTRSLLKDLIARFGKEAVFLDVTGLAKGLDFRRVLEERLATCGVLLAIIGKDWLDAKDDDGSKRLDNPKDFVRLEIAAALKRNIPVIPVLVRGARMPRAEDLPEDLKDLVFRDGVELTHARWDSDVEDLMRALAPYVDAPRRGFRSWPWRVTAGVVTLALVCAAGYFGYGKYQDEVARKASDEAAAIEAKRVEAEKADAEQAARLKATADAEERARLKAAAEEERIRLRKEAEAKAAAGQESDKRATSPIVPGGDESAPGKAKQLAPYSRVITSHETGDTFRFLQVSPPLGTPLESGRPTEFKFRVHYNLQSRDTAVLAVSIAQTPAKSTGCGGNAGGQLIDANEVPIHRGQGTLDVSVMWHGGQTKSGLQPKGFLYPAPSLWESTGTGKRASNMISSLENLPEACWRFGE